VIYVGLVVLVLAVAIFIATWLMPDRKDPS
jgi:hypothetical protein